MKNFPIYGISSSTCNVWTYYCMSSGVYFDLKIYITKHSVLVPPPQYGFVTWSSAVKEVSSGVNFGQLLGRHFCLSFQVSRQLKLLSTSVVF